MTVPQFDSLYTKDFPKVFHHLLTGVLLLDERFNILMCNATLEQMFSASMGQIIHCNIFELLKVADKSLAKRDEKFTKDTVDKKPTNNIICQQSLKQQLEHCRNLHQAFIHYDILIQGIQQPILVDYGVSPVEDEQGFYYIIEIWEKDRQTRIAQEQQQHNQHLVTRQLIRSMAHEVKNPLAGILGASQLLQKNLVSLCQHSENTENTAKTEKINTYLNIIMDETRRLNELVNQLLGSHKLPDWQAINVHEPLEHVLTLTHIHHPEIRLVRDYDLSLPDVVADKDQLVQVFLNLINNAVQTLTENNIPSPTITLRTRIDYQQTIGDIRHKSVLKISVIDNGVGIDSQLLPTIFYPLVTGRATGTGLGLALVHDIVERHQGLINVTSKTGETVFNIILPFDIDKTLKLSSSKLKSVEA